MSMLSFGVSPVLFVFSIILSYISALIRFSKCSFKNSLKIMVFSKDSFKVSLCCDFLRCMCCFASLEEV
jgi:hypothetical protein